MKRNYFKVHTSWPSAEFFFFDNDSEMQTQAAWNAADDLAASLTAQKRRALPDKKIEIEPIRPVAFARAAVRGPWDHLAETVL